MVVGAMTHYVVTQNIANKWQIDSPLPENKSIEPRIFVHNLIEIIWTGIATVE
jgi:hypothetical protein